MRPGPTAHCPHCQLNTSTQVDGDGNWHCGACAALILCDDCGCALGIGHECLLCSDCGSANVEANDPRPGEHTCRDCGGWVEAYR